MLITLMNYTFAYDCLCITNVKPNTPTGINRRNLINGECFYPPINNITNEVTMTSWTRPGYVNGAIPYGVEILKSVCMGTDYTFISNLVDFTMAQCMNDRPVSEICYDNEIIDGVFANTGKFSIEMGDVATKSLHLHYQHGHEVYQIGRENAMCGSTCEDLPVFVNGKIVCYTVALERANTTRVVEYINDLQFSVIWTKYINKHIYPIVKNLDGTFGDAPNALARTLDRKVLYMHKDDEDNKQYNRCNRFKHFKPNSLQPRLNTVASVTRIGYIPISNVDVSNDKTSTTNVVLTQNNTFLTIPLFVGVVGTLGGLLLFICIVKSMMFCKRRELLCYGESPLSYDTNFKMSLDFL